MKINWDMTSRIFIALLFIVGGLGMLMNFAGTAGFIGSLTVAALGSVLALIVIAIKLGGGLLFAYGKQYSQEAAYALIGFTVLATVLVHVPTMMSDQNQITQVLKNLAIIGGIIATLRCARDHR
jgi:putative oxidoreductase